MQKEGGGEKGEKWDGSICKGFRGAEAESTLHD